MSTILKGVVTKGGTKNASRSRFPKCRSVFEKRGIDFPPYVSGTVNIQLEKPFAPETSDCAALYVSQEEIDSCDPGYKEWWRLIVVSHINGESSLGFIYRTSTNYHKDGVVELIAHNLGEGAKPGKTITLELPHLPTMLFDPMLEE